MEHLEASWPAVLVCRRTDRNRRPGRKGRRDRARLEGTHARVPGHVIGLGCVHAGGHARRTFSCVQHSSDHRTMIRKARQMIFGRAAPVVSAVAATISIRAAWTAGGAAS